MKKLEKLARAICEAVDLDPPDCVWTMMDGSASGENWDLYLPHAKLVLAHVKEERAKARSC